MSNPHYKEMLLQCLSGANLNGMRFWFTAKNPLPLSLLQGTSETSEFLLDYDKIDDLMICVQAIPFQLAGYTIFHIGAFLPAWVIRETMPELSMQGANLTFKNTTYYRFDGKNVNGKVPAIQLPMGGGGYGSYVNATPTNRSNLAMLLNYKAPIPENEIYAQQFCQGWHYNNGVFSDYVNSAMCYITDSNLPSALITNVVILQNRHDYLEYMATTYDLAWWEMALQTQYSRVKDATKRQLVLDNLLLTCNVSSQNSYNSQYRTYSITPYFYSVMPLNINPIRGWVQRPNYLNDTSNFFGFYGKLPTYVHFKYTTSNMFDSAAQITQMICDCEDGLRHDWNYIASAVDRDKLYKYMCNKNTGWTGYSKNTSPNMDNEYIIRDAYSRQKQLITGDIDFKSAITCPDNYAQKAMVSKGLAQKELADIPILNFNYPGVLQ